MWGVELEEVGGRGGGGRQTRDERRETGDWGDAVRTATVRKRAEQAPSLWRWANAPDAAWHGR